MTERLDGEADFIQGRIELAVKRSGGWLGQLARFNPELRLARALLGPRLLNMVGAILGRKRRVSQQAAKEDLSLGGAPIF